MTVLLGGLRVLGANADGAKHGVFTKKVGTLATLPLARMSEAHELLENGGARGLRGKVVIDVSGEAAAMPAARRAA